MTRTLLPILIELLPPIGVEEGIFVQRARIRVPSSFSVLGVGVSTSLETAREKSISEVVERYAIDRRFYLTPERKDLPVKLNFDKHGICQFLPGFDKGQTLRYPIISSASHPSIDLAVKGALIEAIERGHLSDWCSLSCSGGDISIEELSLDLSVIPGVLRLYLSTQDLRYVISWVEDVEQLPALVCMAVNFNQGIFYASSAASDSLVDAVNHTLFDLAKMLLAEEYASDKGMSLIFHHPIELLPKEIASRMKGYLPVFRLEKVVGVSPLVYFDGFIHSLPLTTGCGRYVVSTRAPLQPIRSSLYGCFQ